MPDTVNLAREIVDPRGELTTVALLINMLIKLPPKFLCLHVA